jgi:hypothetical protein
VLAFLLGLIVALPGEGSVAPLAWVVPVLFVLLVGTSWRRLRALGAGFSLLVLVPALYCGLLIAASAVRPMLLERVATWLVLAPAITVQPNRPRRITATLWPLLIIPAGLACHLVLDRKEDWRSAVHIIAADPRCHGPVLVGEFNALAVLYYGLYGHRPVLVFIPDPRRQGAIEFRLNQRLMHLPELDPVTVPAFIQAHPGAAVVLKTVGVGFLAPPLRDLMERAPHRPPIEGLTLACF